MGKQVAIVKPVLLLYGQMRRKHLHELSSELVYSLVDQ